MAKVNKIKKVATTKISNGLSVLLLILAFLIFALAAVAMSKDSGSQATVKTNPIKITASPTAKPVIKTVKTVKPAVKK